jgi:proteasome assembly chaperone (PAC2) family protein
MASEEITTQESRSPSEPKLHKPWLVAVWPGMGHVAVSAGYYLISKLDMHAIAEFSPRELFDMEHVEVKRGILKSGRLPRSRLFAWKDPRGERDLVVFIGEAQPPLGRYMFCRRLIEFAKELGVERVLTFAAMATQMHPERSSRVFAAATDEATLADLKQQEVEVLKTGQISGLNGVLLGVAGEMGLSGGCLLGEMSHFFAQLPFPAAALAVLKVFSKMAHIEIDLAELSEQADEMGHKLAEILAEVQRKIEEQGEGDEEDSEESFLTEPVEEPRLSPADERRIEQLFEKARDNRSKAYELKGELDKLGVFDLYEDRFLDLFKKAE